MLLVDNISISRVKLNRWPYTCIIYELLALLIMLPLIRPRYVLTLDMIFTPKLPAPINVSNSYLFQYVLHLLNFAIPSQVIEKVLIFSILFLCGYGMHRLISTKSLWPRYFAGIFYMINPFTYERWMAGQYLVLGGYALLPFVLKSLLSFTTKPSKKSAVQLALWYTILAILSVQMLVLAAILGTIIAAASLLSKGSKEYRYRLVGYGFLASVIAIVLNSYWLLGIARGTSHISRTIDQIGNSDLSAFTTASGPHGNLFFNVLSMYGFWLERFNRYVMPNANVFLWVVIFLLFAILIGMGISDRWHKDHKLTTALLLCGLIGFIMAYGIGAPITGPAVRWIILHVPLMKGFREPEKFSALLVLVYAYFASYGLDRLLFHIRAWPPGKRELLTGGALVLPVLYVSTMPFGFVNQLKPVNYPASWYSFNQQLLKDPPSGKVLFLPWHEYMSYDFSPRIIANPAANFFYNAKIISGTDAEFGGLNDPHPTPISRFIEGQVLTRTNETDLGAPLAKLNVQYVLVAHGYDYSTYGWVGHQSDLKLLSSRPGLEVFLNEAYHHG